MSEIEENNHDVEKNVTETTEGGFFRIMVAHPLPFCLLFPIVCLVLIAAGFSRDEIVEANISELWIPKKGKLHENNLYMSSLDIKEGSSNLLAMAKARGGGNIMTSEHLESVQSRMREVEEITITHNGTTFTWADLCYSNNAGRDSMAQDTTYKMPCAKLSAMEFFHESNWSFTDEQRLTWYDVVVNKNLKKPLMMRFGVLGSKCSSEALLDVMMGKAPCDHDVAVRMSEDFAVMQGFPPEHADPLKLLSDMASFENNNECKICLEDGLDSTIESLEEDTIVPFFFTLNMELKKLLKSTNPNSDQAKYKDIQDLVDKTGNLRNSISRTDVENFYMYYTIRGVYAQFGADEYTELYNNLTSSAEISMICTGFSWNENVNCPNLTVPITADDAKQALLNHADNEFSSINTGGAPFPFWSKTDDTGYLLAGSHPFGGSGINMSASLTSGIEYLDVINYVENGKNGRDNDSWNPLHSTEYVDPFTDQLWREMIENNPIYAWFMASLTPMSAKCGNDDLTGTNTGIETLDNQSKEFLAPSSQRWCTKYSLPFAEVETYTKQHFARMWYDLLIDDLMGVTRGVSDPYSWTTGTGCGYEFGGERYSYTNQETDYILTNVSQTLYTTDEGAAIGPLDRSMLIGSTVPSVKDYSMENPLQKVGVMQTLYPINNPQGIMKRIANCNRPGGPLTDVTLNDIKEVIGIFKEEWENTWSEGWDDDESGGVQFTCYTDDSFVPGTLGRVLKQVTLSNGVLTALTILLIVIFSIMFLFNIDPVKSRMLIMIVAVILVMLAFYGALGFSILTGVKINVTMAWTLPFIILGIGVDDMYIVLVSMENKGNDSTESNFLNVMKEVVVAVTMTSVVNASLLLVLTTSSIPAVYLTARAAFYSVVFLYLIVVLCFPAYLYLDMKYRQASRRRDVCFCFKVANNHTSDDDDVQTEKITSAGDIIFRVLYENFFKPLLLGKGSVQKASHTIVWIFFFVLLALGIIGINHWSVGLGLEDFFPLDHQGSTWALTRTKSLASWSFAINWGQLDYGNPEVQMYMIRQFESVVALPYVADIDTWQLWIASLAVWTTRQCTWDNAPTYPGVKQCGRLQYYKDDTSCVGTWKLNKLNLREKYFPVPGSPTCVPYDGGVCRPTSQMHSDDLQDLGVDANDPLFKDESWCPVFDFSGDKMEFCLERWMNITGGGGGLISENSVQTPDSSCSGVYFNDNKLRMPLPYSAGPNAFAIDLNTHDDTVDFITKARMLCDDDDTIHCWLTGIPFSYWDQYINIGFVLFQISSLAVATGFMVSFLLLFFRLKYERNHTTRKILVASITGSLLISINMIASLISVIGLSSLAGVYLTGFSVMSYVLSVAFSVEYSVHIVSRWLRADNNIKSSVARVDYTMSFLMLPTFMSFVSSTIGVLCLKLSDYEIIFFRPLIIVMLVTYFNGCWTLPVLLTYIDFDFVKVGKAASPPDSETAVETKEIK